MVTKHFFKTLIIFFSMLILGLAGVVLVSYLDQKSEQIDTPIIEDCVSENC